MFLLYYNDFILLFLLEKVFGVNTVITLLKFYLGCSGWSYQGWKGPFYPDNLDNKYWLSYYSDIFKFVEVDSTFYRIPSPIMVNNWSKRTPDNFKFAVKFPKEVTHDNKKLANIVEKLD